MIAMDGATAKKTRPSVAKVKVEIDLQKPKIDKLWIEIEEDGGDSSGFWQRVDYEFVPQYCSKCYRLGHNILSCRKGKNRRVIPEERPAIEDEAPVPAREDMTLVVEEQEASRSSLGRKEQRRDKTELVAAENVGPGQSNEPAEGIGPDQAIGSSETPSCGPNLEKGLNLENGLIDKNLEIKNSGPRRRRKKKNYEKINGLGVQTRAMKKGSRINLAQEKSIRASAPNVSSAASSSQQGNPSSSNLIAQTEVEIYNGNQVNVDQNNGMGQLHEPSGINSTLNPNALAFNFCPTNINGTSIPSDRRGSQEPSRTMIRSSSVDRLSEWSKEMKSLLSPRVQESVWDENLFDLHDETFRCPWKGERRGRSRPRREQTTFVYRF